MQAFIRKPTASVLGYKALLAGLLAWFYGFLFVSIFPRVIAAADEELWGLLAFLLPAVLAAAIVGSLSIVDLVGRLVAAVPLSLARLGGWQAIGQGGQGRRA